MNQNTPETEPCLKITPLGGLGEIGLNCQIWECGEDSVMIDCGLMFPDDLHHGIDVLIPHSEAVRAKSSKIRAILLTHGHEDHIGALPWIVPELKGVKIYGSRFTLALAKHKLAEHDLLRFVELCPVESHSGLAIGEMKFHFFPVCHSIPHGFALGVETPVGRIIHSGDFKIDPDPLDGEPTDLEGIRNFAGPQGARALLSDSTNVSRDGRSLTEREVMASLDKVFQEAKGRIVVTLFSSHIQRIQEVFDLAKKYDRAVIISGKSLANNIAIASELGDCRLPPDFHNAYYGIPALPDDKVVVLVTGAQGEPLSALSRMVFGGHRQLSINHGDTVIMSSRIIPGNTRPISRMLNEMCRLGARVFYESANPVHASGHGHREELLEMLETARPALFIPIHGEYMHLALHARLAEETGLDPGQIATLEDGQPIAIYRDRHEILPAIPVAYTTVDGKGVGDVGATVLRERQILGDEGIVVVNVLLDASGEVIRGPEIVSRGFVYEQLFSHVLEDAKCLVLDEIEANPDPVSLRENIRSSLRRFFRRVMERDPLVLPLITTI